MLRASPPGPASGGCRRQARADYDAGVRPAPRDRSAAAGRPRAPRLPAAGEGEGLAGGVVEDGGRYAGLIVARVALAAHRAENVVVRGARFLRAELDGALWPRLALSDARFELCSLANARWEKARLDRVELIECRMTGFSVAAEAELRDVVFRDCQLALASFRFALCRRVRFERCLLGEADFQGADLTGVVFDGCDLRGAELSGATLAGADLRGSQLDGLRAGPAELRGAVVDHGQAIAVVHAFGLTVKAAGEE
jgi:hypothetical protein